ncbi:UDP-N-acetylglucosamine--N-acetylmuramyl-(pentapeptide) pyrophosphoryl-undecaprenol N-acetylglucosamine transferase [uncultured archaeon]|nr:UDP-N-acetylglucosamine--N-acetylmuramyl-(pentapeptide) pyrophosphoryl-undecaprenol N-acetylglucosamine transferase [uncultured archaeon]
MTKRAKHKIYFSVCGEGYGHSSRDMAIAKVLKDAGAEVLMGSHGYVLDRLSRDFNAVEIEREFKMVGDNGAFDIKATVIHNKGQVFRFLKIISKERKVMEKFGATCVVADGRTAAAFAAFQLSIPCIIIGNQTQGDAFFKNEDFLLRIIGKPLGAALTACLMLSEEILIPDFPPPHTVCLPTLTNNRQIMGKQHFIGPVISGTFGKTNKSVRLGVKRPFVLTLIGGHSFRRPIFDNVIKTAPNFPKIAFLIFTKFKSNHIPPNVIVREFADDISQYMKEAELIITQAGHSTAMEILTLGKPALIIPDQGQVEQECNAMRMSELGVAEVLDYGHLGPQNISEKIDLLLRNKKYLENAKKYSKMAKKMNGVKKAAKIILNHSQLYLDSKA